MFSSLIADYESSLQAWLPQPLRDQLRVPQVQSWSYPLFAQHNVQVDVLRCDQVHPVISGNKWFKLKFNLLFAHQQGVKTLASFGGAWSNHLHALAFCAQTVGMNSVGFVRGDELQGDANPMLDDARRWGMTLRFLSRAEYRQQARQSMSIQHETLLIPEGGDNELGLLGSMTLVPAALFHAYDVIVLPLGTGCSAAGVRLAVPLTTAVWAVSALKGVWAEQALIQRLQHTAFTQTDSLQVLTAYHHGGYGRVTDALLSFIHDFSDNTGLALDPVYTGKALYALCDRIRQHALPAGSRVLFIHTGGLQGARGFPSFTG